MSIRETLEADLKTALREKDTTARETLRMVLAALKNKRIELGRDLEESDELDVLVKSVKSRQDSAEQFDKAGRGELAEKERAEIAVIERYLPKAMTEDEIQTVVADVVKELGLTSKKELGRLMKELMARYKGRIDGKLAQAAANEHLN